jgi:hypothetical protein
MSEVDWLQPHVSGSETMPPLIDSLVLEDNLFYEAMIKLLLSKIIL